MNRSRFFENTVLDLLQRAISVLKNQPLFLGGQNSAPPGGIIGKLAQQYVSYDPYESFTGSTSATPSLLDNMAHVRNQVKTAREELEEKIWFMS